MTRQTMQLIEEYEISPATLMIKPLQYGSKLYSSIHELTDELTSPFKPLDIIKKSCQYFGSSYEGRKAGTRQLTGITHKSPISIDPTNSLYFFPTASPNSPHCIWIAPEHIASHENIDGGNTKVVFKNKQKVILPVSYNTFHNQLLRTALLRTELTTRIHESGKRFYYMINGKAVLHASDRIEIYRSGE